eukprot:gene17933-biopygen21904
MGPEVGPASQRLSRDTSFFLLGVRLAETPRLVPRYGPPRARAPGPQMIWMAPGNSTRVVAAVRPGSAQCSDAKIGLLGGGERPTPL